MKRYRFKQNYLNWICQRSFEGSRMDQRPFGGWDRRPFEGSIRRSFEGLGCKTPFRGINLKFISFCRLLNINQIMLLYVHNQLDFKYICQKVRESVKIKKQILAQVGEIPRKNVSFGTWSPKRALGILNCQFSTVQKQLSLRCLHVSYDYVVENHCSCCIRQKNSSWLVN